MAALSTRTGNPILQYCTGNHPWNSVDWAPTDGKVYAAHSGIAHIHDCNHDLQGHYSFVRIDYNDGSNYQISYEHIHDVDLQVSEGQPVYRGTYLGNISNDSDCGGTATAAHTHMSLWNFTGAFTGSNPQAVDMNTVQVGAWVLDDGSPTQEQYMGCVTPAGGGTRQCPTVSISNDGSVAGSACSSGSVVPGPHTVTAVSSDSQSPAQTHLFVAGIDGAVWHQQYASGNTNWNCVGAGVIEGNIGAAQFGTSGTNIILVVRWADNSVHWATYDGTAYCCIWNNLGTGVLGSDPAIVAFNGEIHVVGRAPSDGTVWEDYLSSGSWSGWHYLDGTGQGHIVGNPATIVFGSYLYTVVRGSTDNKMYWIREATNHSTNGWGNLSLDQSIVSATDASLNVQNGLLKVLIGSVAGTYTYVWEDDYNGSSWLNWTSLGGHIVGNPASAVRTSQIPPYATEFHALIRSTDNAIWDDGCCGAPPWVSLGGSVTNDPVAPVFSNQIHLLVRGTDGALWEDIYNGSSWTGFTTLGGQVA